MEENQSIQTSEPTKKEKKGCPLAIVIILAVLAIGGIGFGIYELINSNKEVNCISSTNSTSLNAEENAENQSMQETTPENSSSQNTYYDNDIYPRLLSKDGTYYKVYNGSASFYNPYNRLSSSDSSELYNPYTIKCNKDNCKITYQHDYDENVIEIASITGFSKKIKHYYFGYFGNGIGYEQLLFIMDDGSVEAISLYEAFKNNDFTPKTITGLENIVAMHKVASSCESENGETLPGSGATILAEDKNGNYYDLWDYIDPVEFD